MPLAEALARAKILKTEFRTLFVYLVIYLVTKMRHRTC
jgi:hypothetical protein